MWYRIFNCVDCKPQTLKSQTDKTNADYLVAGMLGKFDTDLHEGEQAVLETCQSHFGTLVFDRKGDLFNKGKHGCIDRMTKQL